MLVAVGNFNIDYLIQDFILMAADQNEKHEKNIDQEFKHGDGWGIAYLDQGELKTFRSTKAAFEDDQIDQFKNLQSELVILHARKASKGNIDIHNVHPFECQLNGSRYLFFHNGTIHDELVYDSAFTPVGATDSEKLFYYLLTNSNGQLTSAFLKSKLEKFKDYTAANFILTDGKITYSGNWYSENPNYYSLKVLQKQGLIVLASEELPHYKTDDWKTLENQDIVSVGTSDLDIKIN
jgi:predicted glutamine amidotransferase